MQEGGALALVSYQLEPQNMRGSPTRQTWTEEVLSLESEPQILTLQSECPWGLSKPNVLCLDLLSPSTLTHPMGTSSEHWAFSSPTTQPPAIYVTLPILRDPQLPPTEVSQR